MKPVPILRFVRISALPSALADVFGGMALASVLVYAGWFSVGKLPWLLLTTLGVYLLGMALNDLLHVRKDRALGKSRPIVTGDLSEGAGWAVALGLFVLASVGAIGAGIGGWVALLIALTALYNWIAAGTVRDGKVLQPVWRSALSVPVIALCRGLHVALPALAMGRSDLLARQEILWIFCGSVFVYFCLVTVVSLFEDAGGGRKALEAVKWLLVPALFVLPIYWYGRPGQPADWIIAGVLPLIVLGYLLLTLHGVLRAAQAAPTPPNLGRAVGTGIRGEALLVGSFALVLAPHQPWWALLAITCFPLGKFLGRYISPT